MSLKIIIASGTDSPHPILLKIAGDTIPDHSAISRAVFLSASGETLVDSNVYPDAWDLSDPEKITMVLGKAGLPSGRSFTTRLITYSAQFPDGFLWDDEITLIVLR